MNDKESQSKKAYNKIARNYEDTFDGRFTRPFKELLASRVILKPDAAVLDVACGTGELLARLNDKCNIQGVGIDISDEMIKVAQAKYPRFDFSVSSCAPLPFATARFDVLTVSAAFHHFPEPDAFAREAFRVLKPGGALYVAEVYSPAIIRPIFNLFLPLYHAGDVKVYPAKELTGIFRKAGFAEPLIFKTGKIQLVTAAK